MNPRTYAPLTVNGLELRTVADVKAVCPDNWFDPETMQWWRTGVSMQAPLIWHRFFVTSEEKVGEDVRAYSVRFVSDEGRISTAGEFFAYETRRAAELAAEEIAADFYAGKVALP